MRLGRRVAIPLLQNWASTFGQPTKLLSRTPQRALVELDWSMLLGLWMIQLFAVKEQLAIASPPQCSSVALAVAMIQKARHACPGEVCNPRMLRLRLAAAVKDACQRTSSKRARDRPHFKDVPSAGKPVLIPATIQQREAYQTLAIAARQKSLTALPVGVVSAPPNRSDTTRVGVEDIGLEPFPRVGARSSHQPWASGQNPVGIQMHPSAGVSLGRSREVRL